VPTCGYTQPAAARAQATTTVPRVQHCNIPPASAVVAAPVATASNLPPALSSCATLNTSTFFYPLYTGWEFLPSPYLFKQPGQALAYALAKFKHDGLSNTWGPNCYPGFIKHVGQVKVPTSEVTAICWKTKSTIEKSYFSRVNFFEYDGPLDKSSHTYVMVSESLFNLCASSMKNSQDYLLSSNSIFRSGASCPTSNLSSVLISTSPFLDNKLSSGGYIQIEKSSSLSNIGRTVAMISVCCVNLSYLPAWI